jgi:hypothetical protein
MLITDITTNNRLLLYRVFCDFVSTSRSYCWGPYLSNVSRTWARLWVVKGLGAFEVRKWFTHNYAVFLWTNCYIVRFMFVLDVRSRQLQLGYTLHDQPFYLVFTYLLSPVGQCFSTTWPRPCTGPWHQLYQAARIRHFSFLSIFHE